MMDQFGWTLAEVDSLSYEDRERVRRLWATSRIHTDAERYLAEWRSKNPGGNVDRLKAMFGKKR